MRTLGHTVRKLASEVLSRFQENLVLLRGREQAAEQEEVRLESIARSLDRAEDNWEQELEIREAYMEEQRTAVIATLGRTTGSA